MNHSPGNKHCPLCGSPGVSAIMKVKDHSVSHENFHLYHCANCQLRFTQPAPAPEVISRYYQSEEYISHTDSAKGFINRIYRLVRNISIGQKKKLVIKVTGIKKGNLLDVGSGTGYFAAAMQKTGWQVTSLEPDEGARKVAWNQHGLELLPIDNLFQLPANTFDAITLWHVLEHVHDVIKYLDTFKCLLKESGKLIIAVPNYTSYDAKVYKEHWAAYDVPRHLYHFAPSTIYWLIKNMGLKIVLLKPMWFDSFYVSLLSSKYKSGSSNWFGAALTALLSNLKTIKDVKKCSSVIYIIAK
jgi:2-polyprenyl-3-methyl-5-hydroxy-6-metoxy-1,4-benzoquinol methylase